MVSQNGPGSVGFDRAFLAMSLALDEPTEAAETALGASGAFGRVLDVLHLSEPKRARAVGSTLDQIATDLERSCLDDRDPP